MHFREVDRIARPATKTVSVSKAAARRLLLWKQGLLRPEAAPAPRGTAPALGPGHRADPDAIADQLSSLVCVQVDPVAPVATNQELVLSTRLDASVADGLNHLYASGRVFEYPSNARCLFPSAELPFYAHWMARAWIWSEAWRRDLDAELEEIRSKLRASPDLTAQALGSREGYAGSGLPGRTEIEGRSRWIPPLGLLVLCGEVFISGREGAKKRYRLAEQVLPPATRETLFEVRRATENGHGLCDQELRNGLLERYVRAFGVFDATDIRFGWQRWPATERKVQLGRLVESRVLVRLDVEGVRQPYFMASSDAAHLEAVEQHAPPDSVHFLPPLDNLLWSRRRLRDLFDFDYKWEIYTPPAKRAFGYYGMPILAGDRLVGQIDPRFDRARNALVIERIAVDAAAARSDPTLAGLARALEQLASRHGAVRCDIRHAEPPALADALRAGSRMLG